MRAAVIGAGVAGLANARVLRSVGVDVVVFEARPDVGGVWSGTRGYPGLRTQNDGGSYAFSELPMRSGPDEQPTAAEVQAYLAAYAQVNGLDPLLRLATRVTRASWDVEDAIWRIDAEGPDGPTVETVDWLVLANGVTSTPNLPALPGVEAFSASGGRLVHASELGAEADLTGLRVVVLGAGKSAADVAVAAVDKAESTTVVARSVGWKLPYRIGKSPFQQLVNTRLGEHLLWAPTDGLSGRVLRRLDRRLRAEFVRRLERRVTGYLELRRRDLVPTESIVEFTHLATPGFFDALDDGRIELVRGERVVELLDEPDGPAVRLSDGRVLPADLVVAATGFDQDLSIFDAATRDRLLDADGQLLLQRQTVPDGVPNLMFAGWTNSFRSPTVAEVQALWIAARLVGVARPSRRRRRTVYQLSQERARARGLPVFSAGTSMPDQDAWIREAGLRLPLRVKLAELVRPLRPADYAVLHGQLQRRIRRRGASARVSGRAGA